jgi:hypothetical protein
VSHHGQDSERPNNSLQLTRLAGGKLERDSPAGMRENVRTVARGAGQLPHRGAARSSRPLGRLLREPE